MKDTHYNPPDNSSISSDSDKILAHIEYSWKDQHYHISHNPLPSKKHKKMSDLKHKSWDSTHNWR